MKWVRGVVFHCCKPRPLVVTAIVSFCLLGFIRLVAESAYFQSSNTYLPVTLQNRQVVLVSAHSGSKFWGVRQWLQRNKRKFCMEQSLTCMIDTAVSDDDSQHSNRLKYLRILDAFRTHTGAVGAIWIDGDTWLVPAGGSELEEFLQLTQKYDFVIGRDVRAPITQSASVPEESGVCRRGVNAGVFWVRRSAWMMEWLSRVAATTSKCDQCAINHELVTNDSFQRRAHVLSYCHSRITQCRGRCDHMLELCCTNASWLVHWPAHEWGQLFERIVEVQWSGSLGSPIEQVIEEPDARVISICDTNKWWSEVRHHRARKADRNGGLFSSCANIVMCVLSWLP